jgi:hypothetical protein
MRVRPELALALGLATLLLAATSADPQAREQVLDPRMHHLGNDPTPEWTEAPVPPEAAPLEFAFESRANAGEWTLAFTQRNINNRWAVSLNEREVAVCRPRDELREVFHPVPAGTLVEGRNTFLLSTDQPADDITFGRVRVSDEATGEAVPARITVTDLALTGPWADASPVTLSLAIRREVDTTGYVACDTHIHTLTFSGHGDASVEERLVTLAGEGVELAISTDHNHNTDYLPYRDELGLKRSFTTVVGNEVTTPIGHFNAFPLDPAAAVPLVADMRAKGARVVILNHPRWPSHEEGPFGVIGLNHFTGSGSGAPFSEYPFDAMELINSTTEENAPMLLFEDWFSLLNRGERVFAVGSSDDPAWIDVDHACHGIGSFVAAPDGAVTLRARVPGCLVSVGGHGRGREGTVVAAAQRLHPRRDQPGRTEPGSGWDRPGHRFGRAKPVQPVCPTRNLVQSGPVRGRAGMRHCLPLPIKSSRPAETSASRTSS